MIYCVSVKDKVTRLHLLFRFSLSASHNMNNYSQKYQIEHDLNVILTSMFNFSSFIWCVIRVTAPIFHFFDSIYFILWSHAWSCLWGQAQTALRNVRMEFKIKFHQRTGCSSWMEKKKWWDWNISVSQTR